MDQAALVIQSLEAVVARAGDPAPEIYRRLYAEFPQTEPRFVRDVSGAIRAEMLTMVFDCLMNPGGPYQANLVRAERVNHPVTCHGRYVKTIRLAGRPVPLPAANRAPQWPR